MNTGGAGAPMMQMNSAGGSLAYDANAFPEVGAIVPNTQ